MFEEKIKWESDNEILKECFEGDRKMTRRQNGKEKGKSIIREME